VTTAPDRAVAVDRQSPTPYYQQLYAVLEHRIKSGQIGVNVRLPSENELCNEFGLSRATVRQSLQLLESRGLVYKVANRGVFVTESSEDRGWLIQGTQGFLENAISHQNRSVSTDVLQSGTVRLPAIACRELLVPEGSEGFELVRRRSLEGVPALFSINYLPPAVAPIVGAARDVLTGHASLSELLAGAGYALAGAHRVIRAMKPTSEVVEHLQIRRSEPLLNIRSTSWNVKGERYDMYETWVRSDVVPLEVNVSAVMPGR
jgi:GntR family transcriptional regulator